MANYVLLMSLTGEGVRSIKDAPARIAEGMKAWEAMGGKTLSFHLTMGPYDYVAVVEAPSDEVAAACFCDAPPRTARACRRRRRRL